MCEDHEIERPGGSDLQECPLEGKKSIKTRKMQEIFPDVAQGTGCCSFHPQGSWGKAVPRAGEKLGAGCPSSARSSSAAHSLSCLFLGPVLLWGHHKTSGETITAKSWEKSHWGMNLYICVHF